jgi:hypothetical protein
MAYWFLTLRTSLKILRFCRLLRSKGHAAASTKCTRYIWLHVPTKSDIVVLFTTTANVSKVVQHSPISFCKNVSTNLAFYLILRFFYIPRCPIADSAPRHCGLRCNNFKTGFVIQQPVLLSPIATTSMIKQGLPYCSLDHKVQ